MANPVSNIGNAASSALKTAQSEKVSNVKTAVMSNLKWAAVGLSVVLATALLVPLIQMIPGLKQLGGFGPVVAGLVLMLAGTLLALVNNGIARFLATGLGVAGAVTVLTVALSKPLSFIKDRATQAKSAVMGGA
jgi:bacteriorhodopsin